MSDMTKGLLEHPFFKDFKPAHVELLAECGSRAEFPNRGHLFREGETADGLYLIQDGKVAIELQMPGQYPLIIMTVGAGGVVGWSWLFPPYRWHYDARVMEDTSAVVLDTRCLLKKCREDYEMGYELMVRCGHMMGERLEATRAQLLASWADGLLEARSWNWEASPAR